MNAPAIFIFLISVLIICALLLVIVYLATKNSESSSANDDENGTGTSDTTDDTDDDTSDDTVYNLLNSDDSALSDEVKSSMFPYLFYGCAKRMSAEGNVNYTKLSSGLKASSSNYTIQYDIDSNDNITFYLKWKNNSQTFTYDGGDLSTIALVDSAIYDDAKDLYNAIIEETLVKYVKNAIC